MIPADSESVTRSQDSRAAMIQEADPYFPHTFWRAVLWSTAMGLMVLGLVSIAVVVFDTEPIGPFQIIVIAGQVVVTAAVCLLGRGVRVQLLESQGKIPKGASQ